MKDEKNKTLIILGFIYLFFWFLDFVHNGVLENNYSWLLWYSAAGFLATGVALIIQNGRMISILFCALFVIESLWIVDMILTLATGTSLLGLTAYTLDSSFDTKDFLLTLYHVLIPIGLLYGILHVKETYKYAWIGAVFYASILLILTYFLTGPDSSINCIHSVNHCSTFFSFLYEIANPFRTLIALTALTVFIYIPTNYIVNVLKKRKNKLARI